MKKFFMVILLGALLAMGVISLQCYAAGGTTVVQGMIFTPDGNNFIPQNESNVEVYLEDMTSGYIYSTATKADGSYYFSEAIPTGSYYLYAYAYGANNSYADSQILEVELVNGSIFKQNINLTNPSIIGTIRKPNGDVYYPETYSSVYVYLYDENGTYLEMNEVLDNGTYKVTGGYPEGTYYIKAFAYGSKNNFMNSEVYTISLDTEKTLQKDLNLGKLTLRGFVYSPDGGVYAGYDAEVTVYLYDEYDPYKLYSAYVLDGEYRFGSEVPDGNYNLVAVYEGSENMSDSDTLSVSITSGMSYNNDLSLKNIGNGYSISGYIKPDFTFTNNSVLAGFKVEVAGTGVCVLTDTKGYFEIPNAQAEWVLNISKAGYLTRQIMVGDITGDKIIGTQSQPTLLWAGDLPVKGTQDQTINMTDIVELAKVFNCIKGDEKFNQIADFNMDDSINMSDVIIMAKRFSATSANYPAIN